LLALAALAAVIAGCGGGGPSDATEAAARKQLEAGAAKLEKARSLSVSLVAEAEESGSDPEKVGCIDIDADKGKPERIDMRIDVSCSGGPEAPELIAVGRRAWASHEPGHWTAARISPALLRDLSSEQTNLTQLLAAAGDLEQVSGEDAVEERAAGGETKAEFHFKAPASAFPGVPQSGPDEVEFDATLDQRGVLSELSIHASEDGAAARVTVSYEDIGGDPGIQPPDPAEVHGAVRQITSRAELDALLGVSDS
jgi:hypothetical protein